MDRVPQPWERTDKGSKWPNFGSFGKERESELAGHSLGKSGNPPEEGSIDPAGRDLWSLSRRVTSAAGNRVPNVLPGCCLLP